MGNTVEESLPRNPQEGARMSDRGPQVNRVVLLETHPKPLPQPSKTVGIQPIDDDRIGTR